MINNIFNIVATTVFGLESVVKKECESLGFKNIKVQNGRVEFIGDMADIARANIWLRSAERVLIKLREFDCRTFDDIYDNMLEIDWENYISENGRILLSAKSVKSKMMSLRDNQAIAKKAIVDRLKKKYRKEWFDESAEAYRIELSILKDLATVTLDSSGVGLHKRGYRDKQTDAPMKETLAAGLVLMSAWTPDRPLVDLFSGSGTIPIEAGLIGKNIAPGISRDFDFVNWFWFDKKIYREEKAKAFKEIRDVKLDIKGFDIDPKAVNIAWENALNAGLDMDVKFITKDMRDVGLLNNFGVLISNPPYGQRMGDKEDLDYIYKGLKEKFSKLTTWSFHVITSDKNFEEKVNKRCDRKRKLYNGRIEVDYYSYLGPDPSGLL